VLLPSLHHGVPVVARRFDKFDPEEAFALMARTGVRNAFIPPTALRMLRSAPSPRGRHDLKLRTLYAQVADEYPGERKVKARPLTDPR